MNYKKYVNISNLSYLVLFLSFFTFFYNLTNIKSIYFDEFHYVPASKQWLDMAPVANFEHPPLGKFLIAIGIKAFGDNPVGWRVSPVVASSISIVFCFLISNIIFEDLILSITLMFFTLFNFWFYVQGRIATLDVFLVMFYLGGIYYYLKYIRSPQNKINFFLSSIFWGLSVAIKWSAAFIYLPFFLILAFYEFKDNKTLKKFLDIISFGLLSISIYFLTFIPYLFTKPNSKMSFSLSGIFFDLPIEMLRLQRSVPPTHSYSSHWYTWPLMIRPICYEFNRNISPNFFQEVLLLGNPLQMFLGIISVCYLLLNWKKIKNIPKLTLIMFLSSWLIWGLAPRQIAFFYYFFPSAIFYSFLVPMALFQVLGEKNAKAAFIAITILSFFLFVYFFPILSGSLTPEIHRNAWYWLKTWI